MGVDVWVQSKKDNEFNWTSSFQKQKGINAQTGIPWSFIQRRIWPSVKNPLCFQCSPFSFLCCVAPVGDPSQRRITGHLMQPNEMGEEHSPIILTSHQDETCDSLEMESVFICDEHPMPHAVAGTSPPHSGLVTEIHPNVSPVQSHGPWETKKHLFARSPTVSWSLPDGESCGQGGIIDFTGLEASSGGSVGCLGWRETTHSWRSPHDHLV